MEECTKGEGERGQIHQVEEETVADPKEPRKPAEIVCEPIDHLDIIRSQSDPTAGRDNRPGENGKDFLFSLGEERSGACAAGVHVLIVA